jgi:hypothetical protein
MGQREAYAFVQDFDVSVYSVHAAVQEAMTVEA